MFLSGVGLVSPVGLTVDAACAAMRAGVSGVAELPFRLSQNRRVLGAVVPPFEPGIDPCLRLSRMLGMAVEEALRGHDDPPPRGVPLLLCLPEDDRPSPCRLSVDRVVPGLERLSGVGFHPELSRGFPHGATAGFVALRAARGILRTASGVPACLVCGVDSLVAPECLMWLHGRGELRTDDNSNGGVPGEAAAALLVARAAPRSAGERPARVLGLGFGHEDATPESEKPLLGLGLASAARSALAEAGMALHDVGCRFSDVGGASYGFKEQALVVGRLLRRHRDDGFPLLHCAEHIGDTGAVAGLVQAVVTARALQRGHVPNDVAACFTSAATGERAVAVLAGGHGGRER